MVQNCLPTWGHRTCFSFSEQEAIFALSRKNQGKLHLPVSESYIPVPCEPPGRAPPTGERAQATLRGRPRGRLGRIGSGNGCFRGRPRGRFGVVGSETACLRDRLDGFGSTQGAGAIL